jgi:hypothetical protein
VVLVSSYCSLGVVIFLMFFNFFPIFPFAADIALSQKLKEELKYEKESLSEDGTTPEFLKNFLEKGVWSVRSIFLFLCLVYRDSKIHSLQINDVRGNDEVTLTRKFGDEKCVLGLLNNNP